MDKQELEKMIEKLEKINLYLSSQMEWNLQCMTKDLKFTPINPKDVSDAINLQKIMLNNNDLIDKYREELDNKPKEDLRVGTHAIWENMYNRNDNKLTIGTTNETRGIGKTSFLKYMCKKYNGVFVSYNEIVEYDGEMEHHKHCGQDEFRGVNLDRLYCFDEGCLKRYNADLDLTQFTNYIMIKRVD